MHAELTHTPGILYAVSYWISAMIYSRFLPKRVTGAKRCLLAALFFVLIAGFMTVTDHPHGKRVVRAQYPVPAAGGRTALKEASPARQLRQIYYRLRPGRGSRIKMG